MIPAKNEWAKPDSEFADSADEIRTTEDVEYESGVGG